MKKNVLSLNKGLKFLFMWILSLSLYAQNNTIHGIITDASGEALIGVTIQIVGTSKGTVTDSDGNFTLIDVSSNAQLEISYIGMETQIIDVDGRTRIDVVLMESAQLLDEVVAIGYGTVKKSDLTGSVSSVSNKQFRDQPIKRIQDILQGRAAGVAVTTLSGMPGGGIKVRVRGTTSLNKSSDPLYIVDGIVSTSGLEGINPSDIQSIEVLKDASATAIYGSRGSNGVVLVTTMGGQEGKMQITFDAQVGASTMVNRFNFLNTYDYALALNDVLGANTISAADLEAYKNGTKGVNWIDLTTRTGISQDYKLSISGGNKSTKYLISGNVLDQDAVTITSNYKRYSIRMNLDSEVNPWLTLSTKLNAAQMHTHNGSIDLLNTFAYSPTMEMKDPVTGIYNRDPYNTLGTNPYGAITEGYNDSYRYHLNANVSMLFKIMDGLTLNVQGGYNYAHNPYYSFTSKLVSPGITNEMENRSPLSRFWQNTNNLTWQKEFGDHSLTATAVWEMSSNTATNLQVTGKNLSNEIVGYWNIENASTRTPKNSYVNTSIASGLGRVMYNYKRRYLLTASIRADGSSKFQGDNKWGYFPSVALAWDIANENFMADQDIFDQLKLRTSYGIIGNQDIDAYSTLGMLSSIPYGWGTSKSHAGYLGDSFATPNVRWEKTIQKDIGLDFSLFNGKTSVSIDWFDKKTTDLLFRKKVPSYNGGGSFWVNQGEVKNTGFELAVSAYPVSRRDFSWETGFNASYVKNKVVDLGGSTFLVTGTNSTYGGVFQVMKPGYPFDSFYLFQWQGFDDKGLNLYRKADGSSTTEPAGEDQVIKGQSNPAWTLGWNNTITWKNWSVNIFMNGAAGFNRLNWTRYLLGSATAGFRFINLQESYFKGWDYVSNKAEAKYPSLTSPGNKIFGNSDFWLENASFLKIKNISVSYQIPKQVAKFSDIQLSLSAQNLITLTKYEGMDPEVYNNAQGVDYGAYPVPRTFTFGAKFTF